MKIRPYLTEFYQGRSKFLTTLFLCVVAFSFYATFHQSKKNNRYVEKQHKRIETAMDDKMPHPLRILRFWEHRGEVDALRLIKETDAKTFWVVTPIIDPTLSMNYFTYPKELYMNVETQEEMMYDYLSDEVRTHEQKPPKQYDKVVVIGKYQSMVKDIWSGSY